ncbi:MAG: type IV fimbrial biogenesis protein FimT [Motiliproteus sp.]|jgi:type IV fimbrial biogenesis protein FimT
MSRTLVRRHPGVSFSASQRGFTLTELVIVLGIATTLSTLGVSGFQSLVASNQVDTLATTLRTSLMWARSEAINRGQRVLLCRQALILGECAGSGATGKISWNQGWLVFVDQDNDRQLDATQGDLLLQVFEPLGLRQRLMWNRGDFIAYDASGALGSLNGTFCVGHANGDTGLQRKLVLPHSGRLRTAATPCHYTLVL